MCVYVCVQYVWLQAQQMLISNLCQVAMAARDFLGGLGSGGMLLLNPHINY